MTPAFVPPEHLARANGLLTTAGAASHELAGPPVGSLLFGMSASIPFLANAGTSLVSAILLASLPSLAAARAGENQNSYAKKGLMTEVLDGVRWLLAHPVLRTITLLSIVFALTDTAWFALMALYVTQILQLPAGAYGLIIGIAGAGGLVGGIVAARLARIIERPALLLPGLLLLAALGQAALAFTSNAVLATVALSLSSFAFGVWNVVTLTMLQQLAPPDLLGRVFSADRTAIMAASPLGAILGGLTANVLGLRAPFILGIPILVLGSSLGYLLLRHRT